VKDHNLLQKGRPLIMRLQQLTMQVGAIMEGQMRRSVAVLLVFGALHATAGAQEASDCPARRVISSGVCIGKDGNDCSKREREALVCYDIDPQYTDQAAKANVKGLVRLWATVGADGCAREIKVVSSWLRSRRGSYFCTGTLSIPQMAEARAGQRRVQFRPAAFFEAARDGTEMRGTRRQKLRQEVIGDKSLLHN